MCAGLMGYRHVDAGVRILENGNGFKFTDANNDDVEIPAGAKWTPRNVRMLLLPIAVFVAL